MWLSPSHQPQQPQSESGKCGYQRRHCRGQACRILHSLQNQELTSGLVLLAAVDTSPGVLSVSVFSTGPNIQTASPPCDCFSPPVLVPSLGNSCITTLSIGRSSQPWNGPRDQKSEPAIAASISFSHSATCGWLFTFWKYVSRSTFACTTTSWSAFKPRPLSRLTGSVVHPGWLLNSRALQPFGPRICQY